MPSSHLGSDVNLVRETMSNCARQPAKRGSHCRSQNTNSKPNQIPHSPAPSAQNANQTKFPARRGSGASNIVPPGRRPLSPTLSRGIARRYNRDLTPQSDLLGPLRRYWGYDSFRPPQERVVRSLLAGHDICVVMPTGGGKSLCYQLPALVLGRTAIVVSPLIALMQDHAAQLGRMRLPAAVLISSMAPDEQCPVVRQAR